MRVLKWIFHPVNVLIVIVLVALYVNRQTLFPELSNSPEVQQLVGRVDSVIDAIDEGVTTLSNEVSSTMAEEDAPEATVAKSKAESEPDTVTAVAEMPAVEPTPQFDDLPEMQAMASEPSMPAEELEQESRSDMPGAGKKPVPADAAVAETPIEAPVETAAATDTDGEPLAIWREARRAAWAEQPEHAVERYRALIEMQPDNYDAFGEMGNVLLRMDKREEAVEAYSRAAMLITRSDYPQVAWRVLEIVARLDREKGEALYQAIRQAQISSAQPRQRIENTQ